MNFSKSRLTLYFPFLIIIALCFVAYHLLFVPSLAYIDINRLMIGFNEASKIRAEIKIEEDKYKLQLKELGDSLEFFVNNMTKEFDNANATRKKELQDLLSAKNQQINNFKIANTNRIEGVRQEKMQDIINKTNVYISEYGKKRRYSIVFGTANGSIVYGNPSRFDITDKIIEGLNERYK